MEKTKNCWVIPTDKPSRLFKLSGDLHLHTEESIDPKRNQNIYITNDEEIQVNDYITDGYLIWKWKDDSSLLGRKKIILTTDQLLDGVQAIDDEFLEWFINNSSCESIEVAKEQYYTFVGRDKFPMKPSYKIIIPKEEPKQCCDSGVVDDFCINTLKCKHAIEEPKQDFILVKEDCSCTDECMYYLSKQCKQLKEEIWRDIPSYEGLYQVSNYGNVKSLERYVKGKVENRLQKENILSKRLVGDIGNQYYAVTLCNNKDRKQIKISVLVAMAFLNHTPNGYVGFTVDHIDNNPLNNTVNNLQVITKRENSSKDKKGISKYTGVTFNKKSNKWRSQIWINGRNKTLGSFNDELEAHRAYQKELQQYLKSQ